MTRGWYHRPARQRERELCDRLLRHPDTGNSLAVLPESPSGAPPLLASRLLLVTCHPQRLAGRAARNAATGTRFHPHLDLAGVALTLPE
jgi:hypothetical protein